MLLKGKKYHAVLVFPLTIIKLTLIITCRMKIFSAASH